MQLMSNARMHARMHTHTQMFTETCFIKNMSLIIKQYTSQNFVHLPQTVHHLSTTNRNLEKISTGRINVSNILQKNYFNKIFSLKHPLAHKNLNTRHQVVPSTSAHCGYYGW